MPNQAAADTNWISDERGNRASISYFGSEEDAQKALASLENCDNCTNCSRCSDCSGCSRCSDCSDCSGCSGCSRCSDCSDCSGCSGCSRCSDCSHIALLWDKKNLKGDPSAETPVGPPAIPVIENIHQRIFEAASKPQALDMGNWHKCGTTHCRAGWVVHLAGKAGYALERFFNTELAALKIYDASSALPKVSPVQFYETNQNALADMKRMAELESSATA